MNKQVSKTESVAEFIARGGKVTRVPERTTKRSYNRTMKEAVAAAELVVADLPEALKIRFGIK